MPDPATPMPRRALAHANTVPILAEPQVGKVGFEPTRPKTPDLEAGAAAITPLPRVDHSLA